MSAPPYMPFYVGDYLADTRQLTTIEHGAYVLLLLCMWRAGGALPNDDAKLARFTGLTPRQWDRMKPHIMPFFDVENDQIIQRRLTSELTRHSDAVRQRRDAGSQGGKAKSLKDKNMHLAGATISPCQPEPIDSIGLLHSPNTIYRTDDAARHEGATTPERKTAEREPREVRLAVIAEAMGRKPARAPDPSQSMPPLGGRLMRGVG